MKTSDVFAIAFQDGYDSDDFMWSSWMWPRSSAAPDCRLTHRCPRSRSLTSPGPGSECGWWFCAEPEPLFQSVFPGSIRTMNGCVVCREIKVRALYTTTPSLPSRKWSHFGGSIINILVLEIRMFCVHPSQRQSVIRVLFFVLWFWLDSLHLPGIWTQKSRITPPCGCIQTYVMNLINLP